MSFRTPLLKTRSLALGAALQNGFVVLFILAVFAHAWLELPRSPARSRFVMTRDRAEAEADEAPLYTSRFVTHGVAPRVHAASVTAIAGDRLRAFWYGGSREGAKDVAIYSSVFDPASGRWSRELPVVTRREAQEALGRYLRKLGNPVVCRGPRGRLWLFYVSVSVGGWSGSAINLTFSPDDGETWSRPRRLITSPFLNLSTLVKAPPVPLTNHHLALPVYHELVGLFSELVRLDQEGNVVGKTRLSRGRQSLQPVIVPSSPLTAIALMRYAGSPPNRILAARTSDGGYRWGRPWKTTLPNPNAAVSCIRLEDHRLLLAFNNSETDRSDLSLATSRDDGQTWRVIHRLEEEAPYEASYPYLIQTAGGDFHLLYTWRRRHIKHVQFNLAWLNGQGP